MRAWDPFQSLRDEVESLWSYVSGERGNGWLTTAAAPAMDVKETPDAIEVRLDLPGFKAEDVNVQLNNNILTISGKRVEEKKSDTETYHRMERRVGEFSRSVTLPAQVDDNRVDAECREGVLTVKMPKTRESKQHQIKVKG